MQVCPRFKLKKCCSLELNSWLSIELKKLFQPCGSTAARQHLNKQVSVELYEKQNSSSVLTLIRDYVFGLSFLTTLDILKDNFKAVKVYTSCTSVEQSLFKQFVTGDKVLPLVHLF